MSNRFEEVREDIEEMNKKQMNAYELAIHTMEQNYKREKFIVKILVAIIMILLAINGYFAYVFTTTTVVEETITEEWTVMETTQVANSSGIKFDKFNKYDWNYVMNMIYSDYVSILGSNVSSYAKMAEKFLMDKDAPDGKALRYAMAMKY